MNIRAVGVAGSIVGALLTTYLASGREHRAEAEIAGKWSCDWRSDNGDNARFSVSFGEDGLSKTSGHAAVWREGYQIELTLGAASAWRVRRDYIVYDTTTPPDLKGFINGVPYPVPYDVAKRFDAWTNGPVGQRIVSRDDNSMELKVVSDDVTTLWDCIRTA